MPSSRSGGGRRRRVRDEHGRFLPAGTEPPPKQSKQGKQEGGAGDAPWSPKVGKPAAEEHHHQSPRGTDEAAAHRSHVHAQPHAQPLASSSGASGAGGAAASEGGAGHMPSGGEKHEGPQLCNGKCNCQLQCAENDALVRVLERVGDLLEKQGANRFSLRQMKARDVCRVRKLTSAIDKDAVRAIAEEKGMGKEVRRRSARRGGDSRRETDARRRRSPSLSSPTTWRTPRTCACWSTSRPASATSRSTRRCRPGSTGERARTRVVRTAKSAFPRAAAARSGLAAPRQRTRSGLPAARQAGAGVAAREVPLSGMRRRWCFWPQRTTAGRAPLLLPPSTRAARSWAAAPRLPLPLPSPPSPSHKAGAAAAREHQHSSTNTSDDERGRKEERSDRGHRPSGERGGGDGGGGGEGRQREAAAPLPRRCLAAAPAKRAFAGGGRAPRARTPVTVVAVGRPLRSNA